LVPGDRFLNINGSNVKNRHKEEVASMLQGRVGSTVDVDVLREGFEEPLRIKLTRNYNSRSHSSRKKVSLDSSKPRGQPLPPPAPASSSFAAPRFPADARAPANHLEELSGSERSFGAPPAHTDSF
jgi:hypothetical protein